MPGISARFLYVAGTPSDTKRSTSPIWRDNANTHEYAFPDHAAGAFNTTYSIDTDQRTMDTPFLRGLTSFLQQYDPQVVHFHHYYRVGIDLISHVHSVLPSAATLLTLHDYKALCPANGYLVKMNRNFSSWEERLCYGPTLTECQLCCPRSSATELTARDARYRDVFAVIDAFVAPSKFLRDLYVRWGLPDERLKLASLGIDLTLQQVADSTPHDASQAAFGFFGRSLELKGAHVLETAAEQLYQRGFTGFKVYMNCPPPRRYSPVKGASLCTYLGPYDHRSLPERMAMVDWVVVPSLWWENSPIVILEAFAAEKPVICSNIGGMAEAVITGWNGMHFQVNNSRALADVMEWACRDRARWTQLRAGIVKPSSIQECARQILAIYEETLHQVHIRRRRVSRRRGRSSRPLDESDV